MKKIRKQVLHGSAVLVLLASFLAGACAWEQDDLDGEALVTFTLALPGEVPGSRALAEADESNITSIDVLLFASGDDKFVYRALGYNIGAGTFTVRLPTGTYNVVVLANAGAIIAAHAPTVGQTRADCLTKLSMEVLSGGNALSNGNLLPMWGYSHGLSITASTTQVASTITLTRAHARVDVKVASTIATTTFQLTNARLYNYNRAGTIAPLAVNSGTGYSTTYWNGTKAVLPYLPVKANLSNPGTDVKVKGPVTYSTTSNAITREIYLFEAAAGTANTETNTCLVIGGKYNNSATETFYRVEFRNTSDAFIPLLRNHRYDVEISSVSGPGYTTAEMAYTARPVNITYTIAAWNIADMNQVYFNGQYQLVIDKDRLDYDKETDSRTMKIYTDAPGGWKIEDKPTWISSISPSSGNAGSQATVTVTAATNSTSATRSETFKIVAGNLEKAITVAQTNLGRFTLDVTPAELTFAKVPGADKTISITTYPANLTREITVSGYITWATNKSPAYYTNTTNPTISICPAAGSNSIPLVSTVTVKVTSEDGRVLERQVKVTQLERGPFFQASPSNPYPPEGGASSFQVFSETSWSVAVASGSPSGMLTAGVTTEQEASGAMLTYNFTLGASNQYVQRTGTFNVTSTDPDFSPASQTVTITQDGWPVSLTTKTPAGTNTLDITSASDVVLTTNAQWYLSSGGTNYDNVVTSAVWSGNTLAVGNTTARGTATPASTHDDNIRFSPAGADTGLPGWQETTVQFTSTGHSTATAKSTTAKLRRLVQPVFTNMRVNKTSVSAAGEDVTVTVKTNVPSWWARHGTSSTDNKTGTAPTTGAVDRTATVPVPPRDGTVSTSWSQAETRYLYAGYNAFSNLNASFNTITTPLQKTVSQAACTAATVTFSPTTIPKSGGELTMTFSTTCKTINVSGSWSTGEAAFSSTSHDTSTPLTISIDANANASSRILTLTNTSSEQIIGNINQVGAIGFYYEGSECPAGSTHVARPSLGSGPWLDKDYVTIITGSRYVMWVNMSTHYWAYTLKDGYITYEGNIQGQSTNRFCAYD